MSNTTTSTNMGFLIPVVSTDPGPDYATNINNSLTTIDAHDHSTGKGVKVTPNGLNINADLPMGNNNITGIRTTRFQNQGVVNLGTDVGCLYMSGVDLYYNDGNGTVIRFTQSGSLAGANGTITGLASPASASYSAPTFTWQSAANTAANMDMRNAVLRNATANSKGLTLKPPSGMASDITETLPSIPGSESFVTMDASGNFLTPYTKVAGIPNAALATPNFAISTSSGTYSTTATSPTLVTGLEVSLTTSGRAVMLMLVHDGNTNAANQANFSENTDGGANENAIYGFYDGATLLGVQLGVCPNGITKTSFTLPSHVYVPSSGAHDYQFITYVSSAAHSNTMATMYCRLMAIEL